VKEHDEDNPITSECAKAHGLRRIKRRHFYPQLPSHTAGEQVVTTRREGNYLVYESKPPDTNLPPPATPPTTDVVLVDREQAAKVALRTADSMWHRHPKQPHAEKVFESAQKIAERIRALPPYTKEHVDGST